MTVACVENPVGSPAQVHFAAFQNLVFHAAVVEEMRNSSLHLVLGKHEWAHVADCQETPLASTVWEYFEELETALGIVAVGEQEESNTDSAAGQLPHSVLEDCLK